MDRNYLAHRRGDANNASSAAAGYNFSLLIRWLRFYCASFCAARGSAKTRRRVKNGRIFTVDYSKLLITFASPPVIPNPEDLDRPFRQPYIALPLFGREPGGKRGWRFSRSEDEPLQQFSVVTVRTACEQR